MVRTDGTIAAGNGYDDDTKFFFDIDADLQRLTVPDEPTDTDITAATQVISDLYDAFPFGLVTDTEDMQQASRANAIGLLVTVMMKKMFPAMLVPIHIAEAGQQSSGKSLVAMELPGLLADGHSTVTFTTDDAEMRKRFTTELANGSAAVLCFDNVNPRDTFESAVVAAITTSLQWDDRLLGSNTKISRPMDRILTCTGNNLRIGPDLRARSRSRSFSTRTRRGPRPASST